MEDTQPNEVRLSRKGFTNIPRVRPVHSSHDSRLSKRPRWQTPLPSTGTINAHVHQLVELHLPRECHKGAPGSHSARKKWIEDQKYRLWTNRHLSVVSFRYLDHDNSVQFSCRTQQASQPTGHHARGYSQPQVLLPPTSHHVDAQLGTESVCSTRHAPSGVKGYHTSVAQSSEPGPSRIRPASHTFVGLRGHPQRPYPVKREPVEPPMTEINLHPIQILHATPVPPQRAGVHTTLPAEDVIGLTLDHPGPVLEEHSARWSAFRSGYVDIFLPPVSNCSTISSPEVSIDQRLNPRSPHPNIHANDAVPVRSIRDHRAGGSLSDQFRQHRALEAARPSSTRSAVQEDEAEVLPSPPDYNPLIRDSTSVCGNLTLSLGPYDKPRRILHGHNFTYVVTAHGTIDQGDPIIILGHAREQNQIAFLSLDHGQVSRHVTLHRDWNTAKKPGVSAMTSLMSPLKFASGGYDHRVHLWDIAQDLSGASGVELAIKHTSLIHSLLPVMDTSHKLVSVGADCDVPIYDMSAERVEQTLKTSCTPYHAHKIDSRSCTLLEVT
ncbi:hypothetical protein JVT61DRAFT_12708 [Boletus reticuloceps]|uniref:Uncharacterized protein n=1 Tax=Boletus reticuloceps TaxID=495285 RepID=A0A8I3ACI7_9AGAM|nr:hypothetical protein JVT61DRAFT_12708 [Boletus reticuloceps]